MQTATYYQQPMAMKPVNAVDHLRSSIAHLLTRGLNLPCSTAAQSYNQMVPSTSRFQLALDVLLPLLDSTAELSQRILASYIIYALYAPHPISMNPFQSALSVAFAKERELATKIVPDDGISQNEQLVWVLWKILKGDGGDIGPFSANNLARSPVPPNLRASKLTLKEEGGDIGQAKFDPFADDSQHEGPTHGESVLDAEREREIEKLSQGMALLLAARDRVLTLSEQRVLGPLIPQLTATPILTSQDLPQLIANNPTLAHPILVSLLSQSVIDTYLDVLRHLPPTLPTYDVLGRLLRDTTAVRDQTTGGKTTIADIVRNEVLGWFIHESIIWLDRAEEDERAGRISDDRFAKGVQNLCRFFISLANHNIVDLTSDADTAEMKHFTLRNAWIEEANVLYRTFALNGY
ncbi:hypothetical protein BDY19DRAFT_994871 [Irpex rosettiformis]|uniref:Uncharacterized protein n=1 Tax=Irpex rosettiformis TaxID=378272 RepID=A0ACB8TZW3_9APHY|nr:hypothetical protein BDY19DRAFT_994871 [Irpex rosettiformis]